MSEHEEKITDAHNVADLWDEIGQRLEGARNLLEQASAQMDDLAVYGPVDAAKFDSTLSQTIGSVDGLHFVAKTKLDEALANEARVKETA